MEAHVGACPDGQEVCHNDGNTLNNRLDNLRYDTRRANNLDTVLHGTHGLASRAYCANSHEYTPENTAIRQRRDGSTYRQCRECERIRGRASKKRRKEKGCG